MDPCLAGLVASVWPISVCFRCLRRFSGLSGPAVWTRSTRWFTGCERDGGVRRVQVATALVVAFLLPLFWVVVCMRAACCTLGGHTGVDSKKATAFYVAFRFGRTELSQALLDQGSLLRGFSGRFDGFAVVLVWSRHEDVVWSGGNVGSSCSSRR
ncbi:hypothetical protein Taro_004940 [Colocasia esculenta]|uniref:Uncharacterized protein n=1 Tax=Colocasia esculenta TaxID=4460 RepID=A0A843TLM1_COLES|nr:hypothetical protein [Colocasia esculenta]